MVKQGTENVTLVILCLGLVLSAAIAFAVAALSTPWVGRLAIRMGCVDHPGGRRVHQRVTPRMGGLAIAIGAAAGVLSILWMPGIARGGFAPLIALGIGTLGILALGLFDDLYQTRPVNKLIVQLVMASICWAGGIRITGLMPPAFGRLEFIEPLGYILTVLWVVGVTNAINLMDGLDGLASGLVAIIAATMLMLGVAFDFTRSVFLIMTSATICAACLGFMVHNSHPAKIFMGDTGSLFLGFLIANISIMTYQKAATATSLGLPILALGVPLSDTLLAFTRRIMQGRSPFVADRNHLHHILHRLHLDPRRAVTTIHSGTGLLCAFALVSVNSRPNMIYWGAGLLVCGLVGLVVVARRNALWEKYHPVPAPHELTPAGGTNVAD